MRDSKGVQTRTKSSLEVNLQISPNGKSPVFPPVFHSSASLHATFYQSHYFIYTTRTRKQTRRRRRRRHRVKNSPRHSGGG